MKSKKQGIVSEEFGISMSDQIHEFKEQSFRTTEIQEVLANIETGNNVLLVGKSGCGIDYIVRGLIKELAGKIAGTNYSIFQMTINDFLIDTRFTGELETRLKKIIEYFNKQQKKSVIYFPEIYLSLSAGASLTDPHGSLASRLSFALSQRQLQIIGNTTPNYLKVMKRNNQAFTNNFVTIDVSNMSVETTVLILKDYIRIKSGDVVKFFSDSNLVRVIKDSEKLYPLRAQPGAAIDLLNNILSKFGQQKETEFEEAFSSAISNITGFREDFFNEKKTISLDDIRNEIKTIFIGQEKAVEKAASVFIRIKANLTPQYKPSGVMLFVGPTGVGKTELAKCMAYYLLGDKKKLKIYDMSEYSHQDSIFSLISHPEDSLLQVVEPRGKLVNDAVTEPFSVFLFDEFEKCHEKVLYLFLQIIGEGRLKDALGATVSFLNSIIIMTSNIGFSSPGQKPEEEDVVSELERHFPPEFINRIENIVYFDYLNKEEKYGIAEKELKEALSREGILEKEIQCYYDKDLINFIVKEGFSEKYNARGIQRAIEELVIFPLANCIASQSIRKKTISMSVSKRKVNFKIEDNE